MIRNSFQGTVSLLLACILLLSKQVLGQISSPTDSLITKILTETEKASPDEKGLQLIQSQNFPAANQYFSSAINADQGDREAYFKRGVVNWQQKDSLGACRDWSAVLALGDTATYLLLEKNCHGNMVIEDDTIPAVRVKKMFVSGTRGGNPQAYAKTVVEEMPAYPGGTIAMMEYIKANLRYPQATKDKVQGTVYVNFIISRTGKVLYPYIVRGLNKSCNAEALRVIRSMPAWKPGKEKGKAVLVRYNLPVRFR